jgi:hypothetical protein
MPKVPQKTHADVDEATARFKEAFPRLVASKDAFTSASPPERRQAYELFDVEIVRLNLLLLLCEIKRAL